MLYTAKNAFRASVYDVDSKQEIRHVLAINASNGSMLIADDPMRVTEDGQLASHWVQYAAIHPIKGYGLMPCLFHCYGRKDGPMEAGI